jgi:hypothetical protein
LKRQLKINPLKKVATWDQIKAKRNLLEQGGLLYMGNAFDADEVSLKRMSMAIDSFDDLPTLVNGTLAWKQEDNTVVWLTKAEITALYLQLSLQLAKRASLLHYQAAVFAASPPLVEVLDDLSAWGVELY